MAKSKTAHQLPAVAPPEKRIHDAAWIQAQLDAFTKEIIAQGHVEHALIVGIQRRGAELARRVREQVKKEARIKVPWGALDITLYRDDGGLKTGRGVAFKGGTEFETGIDNRVVYLVDDVLCTGRTIRAALDEIMDFGRPGAVKLFSLIDRGGRELPIQPDKVGDRMMVPGADRVDVRLKGVDEEEGVFVVVGGMR
jgi:pyrimidine operon attenuation protein/uracil phosphoribosyltransferase